MPNQRLSGLSIVVADDHADSAELIEMFLVSSGADVRVTHTAAATLDLLTSFTPDVLLLDISLPDMDGYELLAEIRRSGGPLASVPAVAVTGFEYERERERDRDRGASVGFAVHTVKPIDFDALIDLVGALGKPPPAATSAE